MTRVFDETFEGTGYVESSWSESVGAGATVDEDYSTSSVDIGSPSGWGSECLLFDRPAAAVNCRATQANLSPSLNPAVPAYVRVEFIWISDGMGTGDLLRFIDGQSESFGNAFSVDFYIRWDATPRLQFTAYNVNGGTQFWTSDLLTKGQKHVLEVLWGGPSGSVEWRIDGVTQDTGTIDAGGAADVDRLVFGVPSWQAATAIRFAIDNVGVDDSTWLGEETGGTVHELEGTSAGTSTSAASLQATASHELAGTSAGAGTTSGALTAGSFVTHELAGTSAGASTSAGALIVGVTHELAGVSAGAGASSASLRASGVPNVDAPIGSLDVTVTIGGNDVTPELDVDRFAILSVLGRAVDTAKFWLISPAIEPALWQEVIITDGFERIFAGYVTNLRAQDGPDGGRIVEVSASDYGILTTKIQNIKREFEDASDVGMLGTLFLEYLPDFNVELFSYAILNYERKRFNRVSLAEVLDDLAEAAGASWYIDYHKRLHFFANEEAMAPYALSDDPDWETSYPFEGLTVEQEGAGIVNRVEVVGGTYLSEDATFYLPGTGEDTRISLPFRLHEPDGQTAIQVWRNDGTAGSPVWTALTVKAGHLDELAGANDVLYYFQEAVLEQQSNWPNLPNAVKVTGRYDVPLRARLRNEASYELYGRWFDGVLVDEAIVDKSTAKLAGKGYLAERAYGKVSISCDTWQPGLRSGLTIPLTDSLQGIDGEYLIQSCAATIGVGGAVRYALELGAYDPDLVDMIVKIARQARPKAEWRDDEVLDEIFDASESLPLDEETAVSTSGLEYYYTEFDYGFGTWG